MVVLVLVILFYLYATANPVTSRLYVVAAVVGAVGMGGAMMQAVMG